MNDASASASGQAGGIAAARPLWAEVDLSAVTHNVERLRQRAGADKRLVVPIKANAYGHGVIEIGRHLARLGVDGLATANVDHALALRRAGVRLPILIYGAQLPAGNDLLVANDLTPTVYDDDGIAAIAALGRRAGRRIAVHLKVDAGLGRLGVRLDDAPAAAGRIVADPWLELEGVYTHIPYGARSGEAWSARRLAAFCALVHAIEARHAIAIRYAQAAASSVLTGGLPNPLNTISPGHLTYGLSPVAGMSAAEMGFRPALAAIRARLIHVGRRQAGDDLTGGPPAADMPTGVILYGMDNGYAPAAPGRSATMLCRGQACPVLAVSAEYTVIDLSAVPEARVGDLVTAVGRDGPHRIGAEDVAADLGAPSAAYWLVRLKDVPLRYAGG